MLSQDEADSRQSNCLWTLISTAALITLTIGTVYKNCMRKFYYCKGHGNGGCGLLSASQKKISSQKVTEGV